MGGNFGRFDCVNFVIYLDSSFYDSCLFIGGLPQWSLYLTSLLPPEMYKQRNSAVNKTVQDDVIYRFGLKYNGSDDPLCDDVRVRKAWRNRDKSNG